MTAPATALLEARALAFLRSDELVFGPLDLHLDAGELVWIEGGNGSGKTTLLRVLAGLLQPSQGIRFWRGEPWHRDETAAERLFLGHQLGLKNDLSARENLAAAAGLHGQRPRTSPDEIWVQVGLDGLQDEPVRRLSAGQKKRAALARLEALPAALWLLDEPYANLDRSGIDLVDRLLATHLARGGSALVTSHGVTSAGDGKARRVRLHD